MLYNLRVLNYARAIIRVCKDVQWDAVDTSRNLRGQNVLKTFETAIQRNRRTTRTELERVFCHWIYFHLRSKISCGLFTGRGGGDRHIAPYGSATDSVELEVTIATGINGRNRRQTTRTSANASA